MAKDFFQDIVPPSNEGPNRLRKLQPKPEPEVVQKVPSEEQEYIDDDITSEEVEPTPARGIRNINIEPRGRMAPPPIPPRRTAPPGLGRPLPQRPRRSLSKKWLWVFVALCVIVVGFLALFLFRETTVTITPQSQSITFNANAQFTAYPSTVAATGTLPYTVESTTLTESEMVQGSGTTAAQMKASGNITVYNNYSASSIKLIANTRFETAGGLIFRTPAVVVIPGKQGSTPGQVEITIAADQAGEEYNIGPSRFTIPGLQATPAMYNGIYAVSTNPMTGGFSGNQEGVSEPVRAAAVSDIRNKLQQEASQYVQSLSDLNTVALPALTEIQYTDLPDVDSSSSQQVQINESAQVSVPVFDVHQFASEVAQ
ncbi:MAG TPA: hypothetical protein VMU27_00920, partial [Candidatus Paceibacterota bacterium]|nr:hypothetical protein [Candidatus Paceibacterota bacterium]